MDRVSEHLKADIATISDNSQGQIAYFKTRKMVFDWLENNGKRKYANPTKKGNSIYYYRQALRFGDIEAAEKYLIKYYDFGGKKSPLKNKLKLAHPLASIMVDDRYKFRKTLSDDEEKTVRAALEWYKTYKGEDGDNE